MQEIKIKLAYVVDDDEVIKYLTAQMFKKLDVCEQTVFFSDPTEAFDSLKQAVKTGKELPDMILLDLKMPAMDGWCFLNAMQDLEYKVPVFVFSSSINEDDILRSRQYINVKDYITKPLTVHKVNKMLRQID
jgi:CheY-like chemotaxis protein